MAPGASVLGEGGGELRHPGVHEAEVVVHSRLHTGLHGHLYQRGPAPLRHRLHLVPVEVGSGEEHLDVPMDFDSDGVWVRPIWPPPPSFYGSSPVPMLDLCKQRRDELKTELETLEAMIVASEKAGGK